MTTQKARTISGIYIYKWYILPIGGLYATYHLLGEPETTIDIMGHTVIENFPNDCQRI